MTTDEAIAAITAILEKHSPGDWDSGEKMIAFLKAEAEKLDESLQDDMSSPEN